MATLRNAFQYTSLARGSDIRRQPGITVIDELNNAPNTAEILIDGRSNIPIIGEKFEIKDAFDGDRLLFAGTVQSVAASYEGEKTGLHFPTQLTDFTWLFNRRRPIGTWVAKSASDVVRDLVETFAPDFTTTKIQTGLAKITITLDGSQDMITVMSMIGNAIGGGHWYIDYAQDVHFFHIPPVIPEGLDLPTEFEDVGNDYITASEGAGIPSTFSFERGFYFFRHTFLYDDGSESKFYGISDLHEYSGQNQITLATIPIGPAIGGLTCVARRIYVNRFVGSNPGGDNIQDIKRYVQLNDNTTTEFTSWFGTQSPTVATVIEIPTTVPIPKKQFTGNLPGPATPMTASDVRTTDNDPPLWFGSFMQFKEAFLYRDGSLSFVGPASNNAGIRNLTKGIGVHGFTLKNIQVGPENTNNDVVARVLYSCAGKLEGRYSYHGTNPPPIGFVSPNPFLDATWSESDVSDGFFAVIPDNTTTELINTGRAWLGGVLSFGSIPRGVGQGNRPISSGEDSGPLGPLSIDPVPNWPNDDGPFLEEIDPPGDLTESNTDLLRDGSGLPVIVSTDISQIRNRILVIGSGSVSLLDADIGDTAIQVADVTSFSPNGGTIRLQDPSTGQFQTLGYVGVEGIPGEAFISLALALRTNLAQGTVINNFFEANDYDSQKFFSQAEKDKDGNPTDGIHEYTIVEG
ncbi:hypothetical protein LCGC14_1570690, partial [marine sediment metagenome]